MDDSHLITAPGLAVPLTCRQEGLLYRYLADWFEAQSLVLRDLSVPAELVLRLTDLPSETVALVATAAALRQGPCT